MTTRSPYKAIAIGIGYTGLLGWATFQIYAYNLANLTLHDLKYTVAILERSETVKTANQSSSLQLWLQGQSIPFLASNVQYPKAYDRSTLSSLVPGAKLKVGYDRKSIANPNINKLTNQKFYYLETLDINERPALTLEASNKAKAQNAQDLKIFLMIIFFGTIGLLAAGANELNKAKSQNIDFKFDND